MGGLSARLQTAFQESSTTVLPEWWKTVFDSQQEQGDRGGESSILGAFCSFLFTSECSSACATSSCRRFCAVCRLCFWTWASATTKKHHWCMRGEEDEVWLHWSWKKKNPVTKKPQQKKLFFQITKSLQDMCWRGEGGDRVDSCWLEKRKNRGCKYSTFSYFGKLVLVWFDHETETLFRSLIFALHLYDFLRYTI